LLFSTRTSEDIILYQFAYYCQNNVFYSGVSIIVFLAGIGFDSETAKECDFDISNDGVKLVLQNMQSDFSRGPKRRTANNEKQQGHNRLCWKGIIQ
jgi:hypothetical protein